MAYTMERTYHSNVVSLVCLFHYNDIKMSVMASQITSVSIVCTTFVSRADQRKHQRVASLAFVRGIHRPPVNCPHKRPVTRKIFPFDDVIMWIYLVFFPRRQFTPRRHYIPNQFSWVYKFAADVSMVIDPRYIFWLEIRWASYRLMQIHHLIPIKGRHWNGSFFIQENEAPRNPEEKIVEVAK